MTDAHSPFADEALPPVYLAPMAGFTDAPFRLLCREQGCGHTVTEMVSAKGLLFGSARTGALLDTLPDGGRGTWAGAGRRRRRVGPVRRGCAQVSVGRARGRGAARG